MRHYKRDSGIAVKVMKHEFLAKGRWIQAAGITIFYGFSLLLVYLLGNPILTAFLLLGVVIVLRRDVIPLFRDKIYIDEVGVSGRVSNSDINVRWDEVILASRVEEVKKQPIVYLATGKGELSLPLNHFADGDTLWQLVQTRVAPEALEEDAYKRLPGYGEWEAESRQLVSGVVRPLTVKPTQAIVVGWVCVAFFVGCAFFSWRAGQGEVAPLFLLFVGLGGYLILTAGTIKMDSDTITYITILARYQMRWSEVERIETDMSGSSVVFFGNNKQLAMYGLGYWSGVDREQMLRVMTAQTELRQIKTEQTQKAMYRRSKNTKL